jgi:radical SAM superfamily enzyme YgiQ (UPF0313 family)
MSVMSFNFPFAAACAKICKKENPEVTVIVGGYHASVALDEMIAVPEFDHICVGPGENVIADLVRNPENFHRIIEDKTADSMARWPSIDRTLAPLPVRGSKYWPLEHFSFVTPPSVSILTSRKCWGQCSFCNESTFIPAMKRRPVDMVIAELNQVDKAFGPIASVVIHDSNFFQNPEWLREWMEKYPRDTRTMWPYWASARTDAVKRDPELFTALIRKTNWKTVSLGLESGSDPVLKILNKGCTEEENYHAINMLNAMPEVKIFANFMLAIPGESPQDAMKTVSMANSIKNGIISIAFYTPLRGTVLGEKIISAGRSLVQKGDYFRFAGKALIAGIDYKFYLALLKKVQRYKAPRFHEKMARLIFGALGRRILS